MTLPHAEAPCYTLLLTHTAEKSQRKLDKPLRLKLKQALALLMHTPHTVGEALKQPLTGVYSHHLTYHGVEWRIAYTIDTLRLEVIVVHIGSHENFYKTLKRWLFA
ncbi:MAG: type II toxin-antitoxin system RelE family toxin [Vampirovibrionales bacterium]